MPNMTKAGNRVSVHATLHALLVVHNNLILALRQPGNHGRSSDMAAEFVEQLGKQMVAEGFLTSMELEDLYCTVSEGQHLN